MEEIKTEKKTKKSKIISIYLEGPQYEKIHSVVTAMAEKKGESEGLCVRNLIKERLEQIGIIKDGNLVDNYLDLVG